MPLPCLPCCCPMTTPPGVFARQVGATELEAQGIDDFFKKLCEELGCRDRSERGDLTLLAVAHRGVLRAARSTWPQASEQCLSESIQGITASLGEAFAVCNQGEAAFLNVLFTKVAPHLGKLLGCILGGERAQQLELNLYRSIPAMVTQAAGNPCATLLIQLLLSALGCPSPTPAPTPGGGCCPTPGPTPGGWTPSTENRC